MDKRELGLFLRSRREQLPPDRAGLVASSRRRTPGLRREEVAVLAHISTEYYVRLEQGRAPRPSGEVLNGIARALQLTGSEIEHLHVLAGTARTDVTAHRRDVPESILTLIQRLPATAAFVTSAIFEVLAWNELATSLMGDFAALAPEERNLARRAFLDDGDRSLLDAPERAEFRRHVAIELRAAAARYPNDSAVTGLVEELRGRSDEFERLWERREVQTAPVLTKTFRHPAVGPVTVNCDVLTLADRDQRVVLYSAPVGSPGADALALLAMLGSGSGSGAGLGAVLGRRQPAPQAER